MIVPKMNVTVNGIAHQTEASPGIRLLDFISDDIGLTGAKEGYGEGDCGACTVLVDDEPVCSCLTLLGTVDGKTVTTVEGFSHDFAAACYTMGGVQCGVMQGLGHALTERNIVDKEGRLLNPGYLDYRIPTFADAVPIEIIYTGDEEPEGPDGARTIAEPPIIPVAACAANAVYDAIGVRQTRFPMTPERVFWSLAS